LAGIVFVIVFNMLERREAQCEIEKNNLIVEKAILQSKVNLAYKETQKKGWTIGDLLQ